MASFTGTAGDDDITGTGDGDTIDVSQGGSDHVHALGGDDTILLGAAFNRKDSIDGGDGYDTVVLNGDYAKSIPLTFRSVEEVDLGGGHDYVLSLTNANLPRHGGTFTIDAHLLGAGDTLHFDATAASRPALTIIGGGGNDTIIGPDSGKAVVTISGGGGNDTIYSEGTKNFSEEFGPGRVVDGGDGNDTMTVAKLDHVTGGDGNDQLSFFYLSASELLNYADAGAGDDFVEFAASVRVTNDSVLQGGAGFDFLEVNTLRLDATSFSAASSGFEKLEVIGIVVGGTGDNDYDFSGFQMATSGIQVAGEQGSDVITGSALNDFIWGENSGQQDTGDDVLSGGGGNDLLDGGNGDDILVGGTDSDALTGDNGSDRLTGGAGQDHLTGGNGADTFVYLGLGDSTTGVANRDVVTDFSHGGGDKIDLSAIDADTTVTGDQAFHLGGTSFTHSAGELIQHVDRDGNTLLQGDVDGDGTADFSIQFAGAPTLVAGDLIL